MNHAMTEPKTTTTLVRFVVVIDHREARIFPSQMHATMPHRITPHDPHGHGRTLHHNQNVSDGKRKPELKSYYEAVAKALNGADQILVFGTGSGDSSAMNQLLLDLKQDHHDLACKVVGAITVDENHLTNDQLLARARKFFSALDAVQP